MKRTVEYIYHGDHMGPTNEIEGLIGTPVVIDGRKIGTVIGATTFTIIVKLSLLGYLRELKKTREYNLIIKPMTITILMSLFVSVMTAAIVMAYLM